MAALHITHDDQHINVGKLGDFGMAHEAKEQKRESVSSKPQFNTRRF